MLHEFSFDGLKVFHIYTTVGENKAIKNIGTRADKKNLNFNIAAKMIRHLKILSDSHQMLLKDVSGCQIRLSLMSVNRANLSESVECSAQVEYGSRVT